jgi:hypothetical protein
LVDSTDNIGVGNFFLNKISEVITVKRKTDKFVYIKMESLANQNTAWGKWENENISYK